MDAPPASPGPLPGSPLRAVRLRSPLARAVVPVFGGMAVLAVIFLATWGMAVLIAGGDADSSERLAPTEFRLGSVERFAEEIAESGAIVLGDLDSPSAERALVLDHRGDDPAQGWVVYWAYPDGRDATCAVTQVQGTSTFVDCDGGELDVSELARPLGVRPRVDNGETLWIDLRADAVPTPSTG